MVSPAEQERFERYLKENEVEYNVEIENVEKVFEEERTYHRSRAPLASGRIAFDQYLTHAQVSKVSVYYQFKYIQKNQNVIILFSYVITI